MTLFSTIMHMIKKKIANFYPYKFKYSSCVIIFILFIVFCVVDGAYIGYCDGLETYNSLHKNVISTIDQGVMMQTRAVLYRYSIFLNHKQVTDDIVKELIAENVKRDLQCYKDSII